MIDDGEKWAAVLGAKVAVEKKVSKVTITQLKLYGEFEQRLAQLADSLCADKLETKWPEMVDYDWANKGLSSAMSEENLNQIQSMVPSDQQNSYLIALERQAEFLQQALPHSSHDTLSGPLILPVSDMEHYRFAGLYRVINSPIDAFQLMASGALLRIWAQAVRLVYPTVAKAIDDALQFAISDARQKDDKYQVPFKVDSGIRDWLGSELLIKPFQAIYAEASKKKEAKKAELSGRNTLSPTSRNSLSAAQSDLYNTVGK